MKKNLFVIGSIIAVAGVGYLVYRRYRVPSVTLNEVDWQGGWATMTIDGKVVKVTGTTAVALGRGYTVEMEQGNRSDLNGTGPVNLVLKKDGAIDKLIDYYH